jgi:hypothetical protein
MGTVAGRCREDEGDTVAFDPEWTTVIKYRIPVRSDCLEPWSAVGIPAMAARRGTLRRHRSSAGGRR